MNGDFMQEALNLVDIAIRDSDPVPLSPCGKECAQLRAVQMRLRSGDDVLKLIPRLIETVDGMNKTIVVMSGQLAETSEIVSAWNNVKGFNKTMSFISGFLKAAIPIAAVISAVFIYFKGIGK